jgi:Tol biopolymer transport system component
MGEVYRARDTRLGREVAVKVLPGRLASDPEALARFQREARAVASLNHPHILSLFDIGRQDGTAYAVMELLEGETLRHRLAMGALPIRKAVEYATQIAQALAAAHAKGIVHRDLKPDNVYLTTEGRVKLLDFGLAAQGSDSGRPDDTKSPTLSRHTDPGSGQDGEPSASPDGRLVAFNSGRDGVARIWIKQLRGGGEAPLTQGPDRRPRFSPDGSSVLFLRAEGRRQSAYRVALVGGEPRKIAEDLFDADWSPDGEHLAFTRLPGSADGIATLGVVDLKDRKESVLLEVKQLDLTQPRWSPDGRTIAVIQGDTVGTSGQHTLLLADVQTRKVRAVTPPGDGLGCLAWSGVGDRVVLARAGSTVGDYSGAPGRVFLLDVASGKERSLWSSDRSGHLEIWIADANGSGARQLTQDGVNAENPTASPDGSWIVYSSANPERPGIYKIRPDGSAATLLASGSYHVPEMSTDGRYASFLDFDRANLRNIIRVVEIATGRRVPFEIPVSYPLSAPGDVTWGRTRWTPDGRSLVFIGADSLGLSGVFIQDFAPGRETLSTRRRLAGFSRDFVTEALGLSPDGRRLTIAALRRFSSLWIAEGVPGVEPPRVAANR